MDIIIYGPEGPECEELEKQVIRALAEIDIIAAYVDQVNDAEEIARVGIAETPGLGINGKIKVSGRVPTKEEIIDFIMEEA